MVRRLLNCTYWCSAVVLSCTVAACSESTLSDGGKLADSLYFFGGAYHEGIIYNGKANQSGSSGTPLIVGKVLQCSTRGKFLFVTSQPGPTEAVEYWLIDTETDRAAYYAQGLTSNERDSILRSGLIGPLTPLDTGSYLNELPAPEHTWTLR